MSQRIFYLVTGMSGAGKSTVLNSLEDSGFYCVDNLPAGLFDKFFELLVETNPARQKVALAIDLRSGAQFTNIISSLKILDIHKIPFRVIFLDCENQMLVRRFKETRRRHPLYKGSLSDAIVKERNLLSDLLANADIVINTTDLRTRELSNKILDLLQQDGSGEQLHLSLTSFGFKHGIPKESDTVLDVRFMDNPFYMEELREKRGFDAEVDDFLFSNEIHMNYLGIIQDYIEKMVPAYINEGRKSFCIAVGCTGGHHRSVATVERLSRQLNFDGEVFLTHHHRDVEK